MGFAMTVLGISLLVSLVTAAVVGLIVGARLALAYSVNRRDLWVAEGKFARALSERASSSDSA